jgi:rSAM/selenodomain-associated transferase 1
MKPRLVIMAKAPIMGAAKTRLARDIGPAHAKRIYRAMMACVLRNTADPRWETVLAVTPRRAMGRVPDWRGAAQIPQAGGSLSPRLAAVFARKGPTVCIGTDCPDVNAKDIASAFRAIGRGRHVIGPADDGGFWLIGTQGPARKDLFDAVRWSHEDTLSDMSKRLRGEVSYLRTLIDVDNLAALQARRAALKSGEL